MPRDAFPSVHALLLTTCVNHSDSYVHAFLADIPAGLAGYPPMNVRGKPKWTMPVAGGQNNKKVRSRGYVDPNIFECIVWVSEGVHLTDDLQLDGLDSKEAFAVHPIRC